MYTTIKQRRKQSSKNFYYSYLFLAVIGCGFCFFLAYRFFIKIRDNQTYQQGNKNKYFDYISNTLHGDQSPEEEKPTISLSEIEVENSRLVDQFVKEFKHRSDLQPSSFDLSTETLLYQEIRNDELKEAVPIIVFSTLESPVQPVSIKSPEMAMMSMDGLDLPNLQRVFFSKTTVIRNMVKGKTKVVRDVNFSLDSNKNILLGSVLSRAAAMLNHPSTALYVFIDANAFVPPELLARLLSILQTSSTVTSKPILCTSQSVLISTFNKRSPYHGIAMESLHQSRHGMDFFVINEQARQLIVDALPEGVITLNMLEILSRVAKSQNIQILDLSSLVFVLKKTVTMSAAEKIYFETNTPIVMNWKLSLSKEDIENNEEEQTLNQKSVLGGSTEWSFSSIIDGFVGMIASDKLNSFSE